MKAKKVSESYSVLSDLMLPQHANAAGNVHGGEIMKIMDSCAGVAAMRHCKSNAVTLRVDELIFHHPVYIGQLVICEAQLVFVGKTSMEIKVTFKVEDLQSHKPAKTALSAYFTFVALDKDGNPCEVPPLELETEEQKALFEKRQQKYLKKKNKKK